MSVFEKKEYICRINAKLKSFFRYIYSSDSVLEDFNSKAIPVPFAEWKSMYDIKRI